MLLIAKPNNTLTRSIFSSIIRGKRILVWNLIIIIVEFLKNIAVLG